MAKRLLCLDVGARRIGVAVADTGIKIALPLTTVEVNGDEITEIANLYLKEEADKIIVGYPRNQQGEPTQQTEFIEEFVEPLRDFATIVFQDESLTSVQAEQRLRQRRAPYTKGDIDAEAAAIILQDYMENEYGY